MARSGLTASLFRTKSNGSVDPGVGLVSHFAAIRLGCAV